MLRSHKEQGEINLRLLLAGRLSQSRSVFLCFVQMSKHFQDAALNLKLLFLHVEILSGLLLPKKGTDFYLPQSRELQIWTLGDYSSPGWGLNGHEEGTLR